MVTVRLGDDQRASVTRWGKPIRTLAQKGTPGKAFRRIVERIDPQGRKRDWHPTKGWRVLSESRA
jgi:hypothetical protein